MPDVCPIVPDRPFPPWNVWARECDTCEGSGRLIDWDWYENEVWGPCDDCGGKGWIRDPSDALDPTEWAQSQDCLVMLPCSRCRLPVVDARTIVPDGWVVGLATPVVCPSCRPLAAAEAREAVEARRRGRALRRARQRGAQTTNEEVKHG